MTDNDTKPMTDNEPVLDDECPECGADLNDDGGCDDCGWPFDEDEDV